MSDTTLQSYKDISKNIGDFSFTDTLAELAVNNEFTKGYREFVDSKNRDSGNLPETENSYIWSALSAIGEDITETIYENVLNYIDNVANIDTCKIKALKSIASVLGYLDSSSDASDKESNKNLLQYITDVPDDVLQLLDFFSVNKQYLESLDYTNLKTFSRIFQKSFTESQQTKSKAAELLARTIDESTSNITDGNLVLKHDPVVLDKFIEDSFYDLLQKQITAKYDNASDSLSDTTNFIVNNLSDYLTQLESGKIVDANKDLNFPYRENVEKLRHNMNVSNTFNPYLIADNIENGTDSLDKYTGNESYLVSIVLNFRNKEKFNRKTNSYESGKLTTRYAFYKEKQFLEYFKFINLYYNLASTASEDLYTHFKNFKTYDVDKNFAEIVQLNTDAENSFGKLREQILQFHISGNITIPENEDIIRHVAKNLREICFSISEIREKLKTQCQRNYMRGTFLLVSYVINEYLKHTVKKQFPVLSENIDKMNRDDIGLIEYDDLTEYFNIATTESENAVNSIKANSRFWETRIGNNNTDRKTTAADINLSTEAIEQFYLDKLSDETIDTNDFLNSIFELGATKTYIDKIDGSIVTTIDKDRNSVDNGFSNNFNAIRTFQESMFLKYSGNDISRNDIPQPYYNWKNETHSSYQVHPYLYNFIIHNNELVNTVRSAFYNDANKQLLQKMVTEEISTHLGEFGNLLNIWKDDAIDCSGYRSRYESKDRTTRLENNNRIENVIENYDGIFFLDAIKEFVSAARTSETEFLEKIIFVVENRLLGNDISDVFIYPTRDTEISRLVNHFISTVSETAFTEFIEFANEYRSRLSAIEYKIESAVSATDAKEIEELKSELAKFKSENQPKTFFEKWYYPNSTLILKEDAKNIADNLKIYKDEIVDFATTPYIYDIFRYTTDKFGNSIMLCKVYDNPHIITEQEKLKDVTGKIWFRKNGHPIAFPFDNKSTTVIDTNSFTGLHAAGYEFYDIEQSQDCEYLLLQYPVRNNTETPDQISYDKSEVVVVSPEIQDVVDINNRGEFIKTYRWVNKFSKTSTGIISYPKTDNGFKFAGMFQNLTGGDVVVTYVKTVFADKSTQQQNSTDAASNTIELLEHAFPEDSFTKRTHYTIQFPSVNVFPINNTDVHVSYISGKYSVVWLSEKTENSNKYASSYIGFNTKIVEGIDSNEPEILEQNYGQHYDTDRYCSAELVPEGEYNSCDSFRDLITILEYDTTNSLANNASIKFYSITADASYIPLYSGKMGFSRIWANEFFSTSISAKNKSENSNIAEKTTSIQLLGNSTNQISSFVDNFEQNIFKDSETGKYTITEPTRLLDSICRIYEDYDISAIYNTYKNPVMNVSNITVDEQEIRGYSWSQELMTEISSCTDEELSHYQCRLYNIGNRVASKPIFVGRLFDFETNGPVFSISYLSAMSDIDTNFYNDPNSITGNSYDIVGTRDILAFDTVTEGDEYFQVGESAGDQVNVLGESLENSNSIFGVKDIRVSYNRTNNTIDIKFIPINSHKNYIIEANNLLLVIYNTKDLREFSDYHYMTHHDIWPNSLQYSKEDFLNTELSNYDSFSNSEISGMFETGNVVFKLNEESDLRITTLGNKYPTRAIEDTLIENVLSDSANNLIATAATSIFNPRNTFIFELEKPKVIADIIGTVDIYTFSNLENASCARVIESYLPVRHSISRYTINSIKQYLRGYATPEYYNTVKITDCDNTVAGENSSSVVADNLLKYTVTENDVKDFLKVFVNFHRDEDTGESTLYFNYNNMFFSPYMYYDSTGNRFNVEFKPNTYKKIRCGESDTLDIVIQIHCYNSVGELVGVKDIPVLSYKIYNVSDDKPKFVLKNIWTLNSSSSKYVKTGSIKTNNNSDQAVTLQFLDNNVTARNSILSQVIKDNFTTANDMLLYCDVVTLQAGGIPANVSTISFDLLYDFADNDIEFLPEKCKGATFRTFSNSKQKGIVNVRATNTTDDAINKIKLAFRLKTGAIIDDITLKKIINLDAVNVVAYDLLGNFISNTNVIPGSIIVSVLDSDNSIVTARNYLGTEDRNSLITTSTPHKKLITIYRNKLLHISGS